MSNVINHPGNETPPKMPVMKSGGKLQAIVPEDFEGAWRIANVVVKAGMAPKDMDTPEKCMVAIMQGMEVGLAPMQAMQRIAVINGRPTIWGDAAKALVLASGLSEDFEERIEGEGDNRVAVCIAKRKGQKTPIVGRFSVKDAIKAGLWDTRSRVTRRGRDGSYEKDNDSPWFRFPERMLQMRARGFCLRDGFPDVLGGMYLREEVEHEPQQEMRDITPPPPPDMPSAQGLAANSSAVSSPPPPPAIDDVEDVPEYIPEDIEHVINDICERLADADEINEINEIWDSEAQKYFDFLPEQMQDALEDARDRGRTKAANKMMPMV